MRRNLSKKNSTLSERIFHECLKEMHIPFKHRWIIQGREIDFIVGDYAIELDGHNQDPIKNHMLLKEGYTPIHFNNKEIITNKQLIKLCLEQIFLQKQ